MKYFWPLVSGILLIILIGVGAFYLGKQSKEPATIIPTPTTYQNTNSTQNLTPVPTKSGQKEVTAGGVLSFPTYTLLIPDGWTSEREQGQDSDKLTLTKLNYKITISEAAFGGGGCLYPGDSPSEMAQTFTVFTEIINPNGYVFRRGMSGPNTYTICQKNKTDGSFGAPTMFGHISFVTPGTPDKNAIVFPEVDSILASIKVK